MSVDDITNEEQMTYVARAATAWVPWMPNQEPNGSAGRFYAGTSSNTSGETTIQPFGADTLNAYKNWLGVQ